MAREALFSFVPEHQVVREDRRNRDTSFYLTITKASQLYFPRDFCSVYEVDGKLARFYADVDKKAIAWKFITEAENIELLTGVRKFTVNKQSGGCVLNMRRMLTAIGIGEIDTAFKRLKVKEYKPDLLSGDILQYIKVEQHGKENKDSDEGETA